MRIPQAIKESNAALKADNVEEVERIIKEHLQENFGSDSEMTLFSEYIMAYKYHLDNALIQMGMSNKVRAEEELAEASNIASLMRILLGAIQDKLKVE